MKKANERSIKLNGIIPDTNLSPRQNLNRALLSMPPGVYFTRPKNMTYHNLCKESKPPTGTSSVLGLGLQFCIRSMRPDQDVQQTMWRLQRDVRLRECFGTSNNGEVDYDNPLYIKSKWTPPCASPDTEERLASLWEQLDKLNVLAKTRKGSNLSKMQYQTMSAIIQQTDIVVRPADKGLGPCTLDRHQYIVRVFTDHLCDPATYRQLTAEEAKKIEGRCKNLLTYLLAKHKKHLTDFEDEYFRRSIHEPVRRPLFYINPKIHKTPWASRPVVSCVGSYNEIFSKWIDHWLKKLIGLLPSYLRDSAQVVTELREIKRVPAGARIFTSDAKAMYTNIDPRHGVATIRSFLEDHEDKLPQHFNTTLLIGVLNLILNNNIFEFSDTFWIQISGTAMGTSCACMYATIYYAYHEINVLLPKYKLQLFYYRRFIDDALGIWLPHGSPRDNELKWRQFKKDMDNFGKLRWKCEPLSKAVNFLDLTISITDDNIIETKTFQKALNLYLYIPPHSAHPPGVLRGLVLGNIGRFYHQNTHKADYHKVVIEFYRHLQDRGYDPTVLRPLFSEADKRQRSPQSKPKAEKAEDLGFQWLPIHMKYHPQGISRREVRKAYENACETPNNETQGFNDPNNSHFSIKKSTIALSRPKNIADSVTSSRVPNVDGNNASDVLAAMQADQELI